MPPGGPALTAAQIAVLRKWIAAGAPYQTHWAYAAPRKSALPKVSRPDWVRNPIDHFVLARLDAEKLAPAPAADPTTLVRRVTLDLTGLPPTPAEVESFLADTAPGAYERLVDRLLASPQYGERQARWWLDLARYADTNGYEKDGKRSIWPYRDWVIRALNDDMPFDQFTIEQLAGDLLPGSAPEQRVATGFHRNTMVNAEGGVDEEEFRVAAVVDRVNTTAQVWLGTTLACAQCHSHKYDPFTLADYYRFFAYFNSTADGGTSNGPEMRVPVGAGRAVEPSAARVAELQRILNTTTPALAAAQAEWEKRAGQIRWTTPEPDATAASGITFELQPDRSLLAQGKSPLTDIYTATLVTDAPTLTAVRLEVLADPALPGNGPGRADHGNFVLSGLIIRVGPKDKPDQMRRVKVRGARANFFQAAPIGFRVENALDGDPKAGWAVAPRMGESHWAVFEIDDEVKYPKGVRVELILSQQYGEKHTIGRFRLSVTDESPAALFNLPPVVSAALAVAKDKRSGAQRDVLARYYRSLAPELEAPRRELDRLLREPSGRATGAEPTTLVMQELPKPRVTQVLKRGNHKDRGEVVQPGVPAALHPLAADSPPNRLGLARWLVAPNNPLVGRVTMNRLWHLHFGRGLVETTEEFGAQGDPPTHPELLDWLAVEFAEQKWSLKAMHRLIVTSATYRQSSRMTPELLKRDPANRLWARAPRVRLDAEGVRDNALAVSGLLDHKIGGPSVMPPQPEGIWASPYSSDRWETSAGGDRHRRGLYTFWRRTAPYPTFLLFDAPSREVCTDRRSQTNTPLQALALLNDPAFVEAARALALKMLAGGGTDPAAGVRAGFQRATARRPSAAEAELLVKLYQDSVTAYRRDPKAARTLIGTDPPAGADPATVAAWIVVANVLLNLDETVTRG
jgi:hypothetical protein